MKFAYADPPYLGMGSKLYGAMHPDAGAYDDPETHRALIERLCDEYPDGWAMSLHSPSLRTILPMCPDDVRVMAWCKSFAAVKAHVNPSYAWEPVIVRGGRPRPKTPTREGGGLIIFDFHVARMTMMRGFPGAKPESFVWWLLAVLNARHDDEFVDLFPGSGAVGRAWDTWRGQMTLAVGE